MKTPLLAATGAYGLVGRGLMALVPDLVVLDLAPLPAGLGGGTVLRLPPVDITDGASVEDAFSRLAAAAAGRPVVAVHLAALTDTRSPDADIFEKVNVRGTENVLRGAAAAGVRMIHISTDYVFAGMDREGAPYSEADLPATAPAGPYAGSKFRAEELVLSSAAGASAAVARIAFPYGGPGSRPGLAEKMALRFAEARGGKTAVKLFKDQRICPSFVPDIARGLLSIAAGLADGSIAGRSVFHLVGAQTTPLGFGRDVQRVFGFEDVSVQESSVEGTPYAKNLWLSTVETSRVLAWSPTPHAQALRLVGPGGR